MGPTWGPPGSCRPQMGPMLTPSTLLSGPILTIRRLCLRKLQPYMSKELWYLCVDNEPVLVFLQCQLAEGTVIYFIIFLEIHIDDGIVWPIFARHQYGITNIWALCRPCMASIFSHTKFRRINNSSDVYVYIWNKKRLTILFHFSIPYSCISTATIQAIDLFLLN